MAREGYLAFFLHAHLPFVRHPEHPFFLEESWLFEGVLETYVPLVEMMERLGREGVPYGLTMSLTPPLCEMLADPLLRGRTRRFLESRLELARREIARARGREERRLAVFYEERFAAALACYDRWGGDLVAAFRSFQDAGRLSIFTCGATHGYLPLMRANPAAVRAQIRVAVRNYEKHFGRPPFGIWLPECAYFRGLDAVLAEEGIGAFLVDAHGLLAACPAPRYGNLAPIYAPGGPAVFARDAESSKQVWSSKEGYPGDAEYREFYRDLGFDLPLEDVLPFIHPDGIRIDTGMKYHRVTGEVALGDKALYRPDSALKKAWEHAGNFVFNRERQCAHYRAGMDRPALVVAPYDAELFGHWWYEGPAFLEAVFRRVQETGGRLEAVTLPEYLRRHPVLQVCRPAESSWGYRGFHEYWLNGTNHWLYRHLHAAADRMAELARRGPPGSALEARALKQAARELLLAQASDWAFIMTAGTTTEYAVRRTRRHLRRFDELYEAIRAGRIDEPALARTEAQDSIFQEIDPSVYGWGG